MLPAGGFGEEFAGAALRAEDADVGDWSLEREERGEDTRVLLEAVGHDHGGVVRMEIGKGRGRGVPR